MARRNAVAMLAALATAVAAAIPAAAQTPYVSPMWGATPVAASPAISFEPPTITLTDAPASLEVRVAGAPELSGFAIEIGFDPAILAITDASVDDMLATTGGSVTWSGLEQIADGQVRLSARIEDGDSAAPSGAGVLARITVYPLRAGTSTLDFFRADLVPAGAADAVPIAAATQPGDVTVAVEPPVAVQTEAAEALARGAVTDTAGSPGLLDGALPEFTLSRTQVAWLILLAGSALVVALGWLIGRRPGPPE